MVSIKFILGAAVSATFASAHMELLWPPALRSKYNSLTPETSIDYSMNSPLIADGTYPCKGFLTTPDDPLMGAVTTWSAGGTYNYTTQGTATHGGGSCQLTMSYDFGKTWQVIYSIIGGCMVEGSTVQFTLPKDAPSGEAVFSWNWFNQMGNREMYQNCAIINVVDGGAGLSPSVYPTPFVANAGVNDCTTVANTDVVFTEPGPNVHYGGAYAGGNVPAAGHGITGTNCYGPGETGGNTPAGSGSGSGSASSVVASAPAASSAAASPPVASSVDASVPSAAPTAAGYSSSASASAYSESTSSIGYNHAASPSSTLAASASTGRCRRRKRAIPALKGHGNIAARHERFVTRETFEKLAQEGAKPTGQIIYDQSVRGRMYEQAR